MTIIVWLETDAASFYIEKIENKLPEKNIGMDTLPEHPAFIQT